MPSSHGLKMVRFSPQGGVDFVDEPDPFLPGIRLVPCPKAGPVPRQRGPVIQLSPEGIPLSVGTV